MHYANTYRSLRQHAAEHMQQRRLSCARRSHDGEDPPLERPPADALQDRPPADGQRDSRPRQRSRAALSAASAAQTEHRGARITRRRGQPGNTHSAGRGEQEQSSCSCDTPH